MSDLGYFYNGEDLKNIIFYVQAKCARFNLLNVLVCLVFVFMIRSDFSNRILLEPCSRKAFMLQDDDSVHFFFFLI